MKASWRELSIRSLTPVSESGPVILPDLSCLGFSQHEDPPTSFLVVWLSPSKISHVSLDDLRLSKAISLVQLQTCWRRLKTQHHSFGVGLLKTPFEECSAGSLAVERWVGREIVEDYR